MVKKEAKTPSEIALRALQLSWRQRGGRVLTVSLRRRWGSTCWSMIQGSVVSWRSQAIMPLEKLCCMSGADVTDPSLSTSRCVVRACTCGLTASSGGPPNLIGRFCGLGK